MSKLKKQVRKQVKRAISYSFPNNVPSLVEYYADLRFDLDAVEMARYVETAYRVLRNVSDAEEIDIPARISMEAFVLINEAVWMLEGEGLLARFRHLSRVRE